MACGCREWVRAYDAQRVGNMGRSCFLSPRPMWQPLSNKQTSVYKMVNKMDIQNICFKPNIPWPITSNRLISLAHQEFSIPPSVSNIMHQAD